MPERTMAARQFTEYSGRHERSRRVSGRRTRQADGCGDHRVIGDSRNPSDTSCYAIRTSRASITIWLRWRPITGHVPRCIPVPAAVHDTATPPVSATSATGAASASATATSAIVYVATPVHDASPASRKNRYRRIGQRENPPHHHHNGDARMRDCLRNRATGVHLRRHVRMAQRYRHVLVVDWFGRRRRTTLPAAQPRRETGIRLPDHRNNNYLPAHQPAHHTYGTKRADCSSRPGSPHLRTHRAQQRGNRHLPSARCLDASRILHHRHHVVQHQRSRTHRPRGEPTEHAVVRLASRRDIHRHRGNCRRGEPQHFTRAASPTAGSTTAGSRADAAIRPC